MRDGTPKSRLLGFCSENDVVLALFLGTKRRRFGCHLSFFLKSRAHPKTSLFWICFKSLIQNDVFWSFSPKRRRLVPNDVVLGWIKKKEG